MEENVTQTNGGITINVDVRVTKRHVCEKDYAWNPATCSCKNRKYLISIKDDSAIICDEVIESYDYKTKTRFNVKKVACETQNFYVLLAFLFTTVALLIAVSIYCYLITNQAKQKYLLSF